jgi:F-type H+-transporting ATPase subunit epsilon
MGGFAEVDSDEVTVLVNKAELGSSIDANAAEADFQKATTAVAGMEGQPVSAEKLKAQQQLNEARARMQASKSAD